MHPHDSIGLRKDAHHLEQRSLKALHHQARHLYLQRAASPSPSPLPSPLPTALHSAGMWNATLALQQQ
eukprot:CAMPEP_0179486054 /NCGR_PEP_ID=MMETSP0799-20121207/62479_1 /TAXON_ID=46947 /ORGANISM="Geminigera cryophila, Strain CCMP2564" /LENGTH=67 /DNA_ID=CAMNT_0021300671 /DNA_START=1001 /DNA_END=1204 /DNA_ORIENTATION=+